jgi:hypothetical protein
MMMTRAMIAALAALALAAPSFAEQRSLEDHARDMALLRDLLAEGRSAEALEQVTALRDDEIVDGDLRLVPDATVLARAEAAARRGGPARVSSLEAWLDADALPPGAAAPDAALLGRLRERQAIPEIAEDGELRVQEIPWPERLTAMLERAKDAIARALQRLLEWLFGLARPAADAGGLSAGAIAWTLVAIAVAALVGAGVALWRARRAGPLAASPVAEAPGAQDPDEDPLARSANEWRLRAAELEAAGRRREAVRAWYHAVLATAFANGALQPRRGRTNWEHVRSLPPEIAWRRELNDLTRLFDASWYGMAEVSDETLAACERLARSILHVMGLRAVAA